VGPIDSPSYTFHATSLDFRPPPHACGMYSVPHVKHVISYFDPSEDTSNAESIEKL
jgi:hypothetical protein